MDKLRYEPSFEKRVDLERVDFFTLDWHLFLKEVKARIAMEAIEDVVEPEDIWWGQSHVKNYCHQLISFQGKSLDLFGKKEQILDLTQAPKGDEAEYYTFHIASGEAALICKISINRHPQISVYTSIIKKDPEKHLPKGLGQVVYRRVLDGIQALADRENKPVTHEVSRGPKISATPMTNERWNELFLPLLNSDGRQYVVDAKQPDILDYTYQPRQSPFKS